MQQSKKQQLHFILRQLSQSKDPSQLEPQLIELTSEIGKTIETLIQFIKAPSDSLLFTQYVIIYLRTYLRSKILPSKQNNFFITPSQDRLQIGNWIIDLILHKQHPKKILSLLCATFEGFLSVDYSIESKTAENLAKANGQVFVQNSFQSSVLHPMLSVIYQALLVKQNSKSWQIVAALKLLSILIEQISKKRDVLGNRVKDMLMRLNSLALSVIENLKLPQDSGVLSPLTDSFELYSQYLQILKEWSNCIYSLVQKLAPVELRDILKIVYFDPQLTSHLTNILSLQISPQSSGQYQTLYSNLKQFALHQISASGVNISQEERAGIQQRGETLDDSLNNIKSNCLDIVSNIIPTSMQGKQNPQSPFNLIPIVFLRPLINSIKNNIEFRWNQIHCGDDDCLDIQDQESGNQRFTLSILCALSRLCKHKAFYQIFSDMKKQLLLDIICPLIASTQIQKSDAYEEPQEFFNLANDTCRLQESDIPKTEAAKLLEKVTETIDGTLPYAIHCSCDMIHYGMLQMLGKFEQGVNEHKMMGPVSIVAGSGATLAQSDKEKDQLTRRPFVVIDPQNPPSIFSKLEKGDLVQTALMMLCVQSFNTASRADLVSRIDSTIQLYFKEICQSNMLVKSRFILFISYFADLLFSNDIKKRQQMVEIIVEWMHSPLNQGNEQNEQSVEAHIIAIHAVDCVNNFLMDKMIHPILLPAIPALIDKFATLCVKTNINSFFEMLLHLLKFKEYTPPEQVVTLTRSLVQRIIIEQNKNKEQHPSRDIIIAKCWNTLRQFIGDEKFSEYSDSIEQEMIPLFKYMEDPSNIDFDQDILLFIMTQIKHKKSVSLIEWELLPHLISFFRKYHTTFGMLLRVYCYYLSYGKNDIVLKRDEFLKHLLQVASQVISGTSSNEQTLSNAEGALMFILILKYIPQEAIGKEWIYLLLDATFNRMKQMPRTNFLKRTLINVVMMSLSAAPKSTIEYLQEKNLVKDVLITAGSILSLFKFPEQRKIFILGLLAIIKSDNLPPSFVDNTKMIIQLSIATLALQKQEEQNLVTKSKARNFANFGQETNGKKNQQAKTFSQEIDKARYLLLIQGIDQYQFDFKLTLDSIQIGMKQIDEFNEFTSVIQNSYAKHKQGMDHIFSMLTGQQRKWLQNILKTKRFIQMGVKGAVNPGIARKTIKVKKRDDLPNQQMTISSLGGVSISSSTADGAWANVEEANDSEFINPKFRNEMLGWIY